MVREFHAHEIRGARREFRTKAANCRLWQFRRRAHYQGMAATMSGILATYFGEE